MSTVVSERDGGPGDTRHAGPGDTRHAGPSGLMPRQELRLIAASVESGRWPVTDADRQECRDEMMKRMRLAQSTRDAALCVRVMAALDGVNVRREANRVAERGIESEERTAILRAAMGSDQTRGALSAIIAQSAAPPSVQVLEQCALDTAAQCADPCTVAPPAVQDVASAPPAASPVPKAQPASPVNPAEQIPLPAPRRSRRGLAAARRAAEQRDRDARIAAAQPAADVQAAQPETSQPAVPEAPPASTPPRARRASPRRRKPAPPDPELMSGG